jgi:hypothetical protein
VVLEEVAVMIEVIVLMGSAVNVAFVVIAEIYKELQEYSTRKCIF